jgi:flagellar biosynthesis/type III secretory pathway protein FliH
MRVAQTTPILNSKEIDMTELEAAYAEGFSNGEQCGYDRGKDIGYQDGYDAGYEEGQQRMRDEVNYATRRIK